jgi:hypothetical protein
LIRAEWEVDLLKFPKTKEQEEFPTNSRPIFCSIFDVKSNEKIRGRYAERPKTGLSLFKSMVPTGGIEPTAQARTHRQKLSRISSVDHGTRDVSHWETLLQELEPVQDECPLGACNIKMVDS